MTGRDRLCRSSNGFRTRKNVHGTEHFPIVETGKTKPERFRGIGRIQNELKAGHDGKTQPCGIGSPGLGAEAAPEPPPDRKPAGRQRELSVIGKPLFEHSGHLVPPGVIDPPGLAGMPLDRSVCQKVGKRMLQRPVALPIESLSPVRHAQQDLRRGDRIAEANAGGQQLRQRAKIDGAPWESLQYYPLRDFWRDGKQMISA